MTCQFGVTLGLAVDAGPGCGMSPSSLSLLPRLDGSSIAGLVESHVSGDLIQVTGLVAAVLLPWRQKNSGGRWGSFMAVEPMILASSS